jgi:3-methyladenine DNA glycosylase AlkD
MKLKKELRSLANREQAEILQRFFKTGKGEYGEGDIFLGLSSQQIRNVAKKFHDLKLNDIQELLKSKIHTERTCALRILVHQYNKAKDMDEKKKIFYFYLNNTTKINNWDLVDISAWHIVGRFLLEDYSKKEILYKLAQSKNLWEKRISIVSTYAFIRENKFDDTLAISEILLDDSHDLIHKAVGWMLREVGKRNEKILEEFLKKNYSGLPRTTLRYAIEKFPEDKRKRFLRGEFR